ncbi:Acetyltransferase [Bacillus sp. ZZV12-4809]|nr:Acetyltransferase [Bacillus sp. ZZV12-4809]
MCQADPEDAEQLVELLHSILEFSDSAITVERKRRGLKKRSSKRELRWSALLQ